MEFASSRSDVMLLMPGYLVRTASTLETVPQATARLSATCPETGAPFTDPPVKSEPGHMVFTAKPVAFGSPAVTIGSPALYGFAEAGVPGIWFALLTTVKCVPLLPT